MLGRGLLAHLHAEKDVLAHIEVRKERVRLEHHRNAPLGRGHVGDIALVDQDPALGRRVEPGNHAQRGRLAAAGWPEQHDEIARGRGEARAVDRLREAPVLADGVETQAAQWRSSAAVCRDRPPAGAFACSGRPGAALIVAAAGGRRNRTPRRTSPHRHREVAAGARRRGARAAGHWHRRSVGAEHPAVQPGEPHSGRAAPSQASSP